MRGSQICKRKSCFPKESRLKFTCGNPPVITGSKKHSSTANAGFFISGSIKISCKKVQSVLRSFNRRGAEIETKINKYKNFWQNNIEAIEDISKKLEKYIFRLEKKYSGFDSIYYDINNELDVLSSIYSSYNNLKGKDYILKLKAVLNSINKNHNNDNNNFELVHHLYSKIDNLRNASFDKFPAMDHSDTASAGKIGTKPNTAIHENAKYKWITFSRNRSWFIFRYNSFKIIKYNKAEIIHEGRNNFLKTVSGKYMIIDLLSKHKLPELNHPEYFLLIEFKNKTECYAAGRPGKRIFSEKNVISPRIIPFQKIKKHKGRVRIFGKNHIYL